MQKIKFPIVKNLEYLDLSKNGSIIKSYKGSDLNGLKWRQVQIKIGSDVGSDKYNYILKMVNDDQIHKGLIRGISEIQKNIELKDPIINELKNQIDNIQKNIGSLQNSSSMPIDLLLSISKQSYETQITFLNSEISRREIIINKLESKIDSLESELDEAADIIEDYKSKTGLGQYLDIAKTFLTAKQGNLKPISNLKDSAPETIPAEIIQVLGVVAWDQIPAEQLTEIITYLKIFIQKLPLKG